MGGRWGGLGNYFSPSWRLGSPRSWCRQIWLLLRALFLAAYQGWGSRSPGLKEATLGGSSGCENRKGGDWRGAGERRGEKPRLLAQELGGWQHHWLGEGSRGVRGWVRERRSRQAMGMGKMPCAWLSTQEGGGAGRATSGGGSQEEVVECGADAGGKQKDSGRRSCQALSQHSFSS